MKKMIALIMALVTVGCAESFGRTEGPANHLAVVKYGDIVKVIYDGHNVSPVKVTISDADGHEVYSEKLESHAGFIRPYNFSLLPRGDYQVCVTDKATAYTEKICLRDKVWQAHVSKLAGCTDKYLVTVPRQGNGMVDIAIYDELNQMVYNEKSSADVDFVKIYDLKNLEGGAVFHLVNKSTGEEIYFDNR